MNSRKLVAGCPTRKLLLCDPRGRPSLAVLVRDAMPLSSAQLTSIAKAGGDTHQIGYPGIILIYHTGALFY